MKRTVVQCYCGEIPADCEEIRARTERAARRLGYGYELHDISAIDELRDVLNSCYVGVVLASDIWRIRQACQRPDMIYVDIDCELLGDIPEGDIPAHELLHGQPNIGIFSVNGNCRFYSELLDEASKRGISLNTFAWPAKVLRDKRVIEIPADRYVHKRATYNAIRTGGIDDGQGAKEADSSF